MSMEEFSLLATNHCHEEIFSSAHFYKNPNWTDQQNREAFGACFTEYGHGHNYRLQVEFNCPSEAVSAVKELLSRECASLDHQHLNFAVEYFSNHIPTTENIAIYLHQRLKMNLPQVHVVRLKLFEMDDLWVELKDMPHE